MFAVLLLAAVVQDTPAPAPMPTPVPAPTAAAKPKKEPLICRPIPNSASRMGSDRECHTAAGWRALGDGFDSQGRDRADGGR